MDQFVKMTKEGETIEVSPLVVEDHKKLGWKVVEEKTDGSEQKATVEAEAARKKAEAKAIRDAKSGKQ